MGLDETGRIGRIIVHPTNPDIVFACALGRATGPQQERGVLSDHRWRRALGARTFCRRKHRLLRHFAWTRTIRARCSRARGKWTCTPTASSVADRAAGFMSRATAATSGRVSKLTGCRTLRSARSMWRWRPPNSNRVYALIQTADQGSMWRSDDGGENWRVVNWDRALIGRAGYYIHIAVSPGERK